MFLIKFYIKIKKTKATASQSVATEASNTLEVKKIFFNPSIPPNLLSDS